MARKAMSLASSLAASASTRALSTSAFPLSLASSLAANSRGVSSSSFTGSNDAPASRSASTASTFPRYMASCSGVDVKSPALIPSSDAPASMSNFMV
eukprot:scaffold22335_cov71-Phaeocystis_antarctica.AAC.6